MRRLIFAAALAAACSALAGPAMAQSPIDRKGIHLLPSTPGSPVAEQSESAQQTGPAQESGRAQQTGPAQESGRAEQAGPAQETGPAQEAAPPQETGGFRVVWREGLRIESDDGRFQLAIGGRIQYDWVIWGDTSRVEDHVAGPVQDGTEFRRARLFVEGVAYERVEYKAQFDFAGGEVVFKDVYFGIRDPKYGFRMGHMKEPFGLETLTSSKYITFVERALPTLFDAERNAGFLLHGAVIGDRFQYGIGLYRETGDDGIGDERGRYNVVGRLAGIVLDENEGRRLVHLGAAFAFQNGSGDPRVFAQRPEVHLAPRFISSGEIPTDSANALGLEGAVISGPFSAQAEWKVVALDSTATDDPVVWGWYAFGSYFLTGESRPYEEAAFERLRPNQNFLDGSGGLGAWEIALRYSVLDLGAEGIAPADPAITGTRLDDVTIGLNWYWNPMTLMRLNAVRADIDGVGHVWAFLWRGQIEF